MIILLEGGGTGTKAGVNGMPGAMDPDLIWMTGFEVEKGVEVEELGARGQVDEAEDFAGGEQLAEFEAGVGEGGDVGVEGWETAGGC